MPDGTPVYAENPHFQPRTEKILVNMGAGTALQPLRANKLKQIIIFLNLEVASDLHHAVKWFHL
jgi:hypothetical protein